MVNSLEILAWLTSAYSVTGDALYQDTFWGLVRDHGYAKNALNAKIDSDVDNNDSDTELIFLAYHSLYYARQRLGPDDPLLANVTAMVDAVDASIDRSWRIVRPEMSPLWAGIYLGTAGRMGADKQRDAEAAAWYLRRWMVDNIDWPMDYDERSDLCTKPVPDGHENVPVMTKLLPPSERGIQKWNGDPYEFSSGSGFGEVEPSIWLLPYAIMKYNELI